MSTRVLIVEYNAARRRAIAEAVAPLTPYVITLARREAAMNVLAGIQFDVLIPGQWARSGELARFLAGVRELQPDLHVIVPTSAGGATEDADDADGARDPLPPVFRSERLNEALQMKNMLGELTAPQSRVKRIITASGIFTRKYLRR